MPQRVSVPGVGTVAFPDDMSTDDMRQKIRMHLSTVQPPVSTVENAIPADAGIRPQTWTDKLQHYRDTMGRLLAPLIGVDFDQMAGDEAKGILRQMVMFHGSPHVFDQFDISKVGTGEGAQAYGHGLYFAQDPATARYYQNKLTTTVPGALEGGSRYQIAGAEFPKGRSGHAALDTAQDIEHMLGYRKMGSTEMENVVKDNIERRIGNFYKTTTGQGSAYEDMDALVSYYIRHAKDAPAESIAENRGALYSVDIPDEHIGKMLDWDKPLSQQTPEVREKLKPFIDKLKAQASSSGAGWGDYADPSKVEDIHTGETLYRDIVQAKMAAMRDADLKASNGLVANARPRPYVTIGAEEASQHLRSLGIPGIKYLDQGSRTAGEGTHNFVVFDPSIIKDVKRQ